MEYLNANNVIFVQNFELPVNKNIRFFINTGAFPNRLSITKKEEPHQVIDLKLHLSAIGK